jgi:AmiR/NasT family two-component response regulator
LERVLECEKVGSPALTKRPENGSSKMQSRRIAIAVHDQHALADIAAWVTRARHLVVAQADSAEEVSRSKIGVGMDLIILEMQPKDLGDLSALQNASRRYDVPIIAIGDSVDDRFADAPEGNRVFAHLMKPVREAELLAAIPLVCNRFQEARALREETLSMQRVLEERKLIERAKGIVMRRQSLDEPSAFRYLQQMARNHRLKMADLAKSVIVAHSALNAPESSECAPLSNAYNKASRRQSP